MSGRSTIKTVVVLVILILVGVLVVLGLNTAKTYMTGATVGYEPKNVMAKSGNDGKSGTVTWMTEKPVMAVVEYGTTPASLLLRAIESEQTTSHSVSLSPLKPNVTYYFRIRVREKNDEDTIYDNNGLPYSFKTKSEDGEATAADPTKSPNGPTMVPTGLAKKDPEGACNRTTDYNKDSVVNIKDYMDCMKGVKTTPGASPAPTIATGGTPVPTTSVRTSVTPTKASKCASGTDYNKDGVVNSMDLIKCRQDNP